MKVWSGQRNVFLIYSSQFWAVKEILARPMIEVNSRVDRIAKDLQEQIAHGKLKPGERLPSERTLCSLFGVGRTTIREALKSLAVRGLVARSARGAVVTDAESIHIPGDLPALAAQTSIRQ